MSLTYAVGPYALPVGVWTSSLQLAACVTKWYIKTSQEIASQRDSYMVDSNHQLNVKRQLHIALSPRQIQAT